mgnify:CR=1 FL=1
MNTTLQESARNGATMRQTEEMVEAVGIEPAQGRSLSSCWHLRLPISANRRAANSTATRRRVVQVERAGAVLLIAIAVLLGVGILG